MGAGDGRGLEDIVSITRTILVFRGHRGLYPRRVILETPDCQRGSRPDSRSFRNLCFDHLYHDENCDSYHSFHWFSWGWKNHRDTFTIAKASQG